MGKMQHRNADRRSVHGLLRIGPRVGPAAAAQSNPYQDDLDQDLLLLDARRVRCGKLLDPVVDASLGPLRLLPAGAIRRVGLAPTGECRLSTAHTHSGHRADIIRSPHQRLLASSGGTVRPRAFAVLRLMISAKLFSW